MRSGATALKLVTEDEPPSTERLRRRVQAETVREGPDVSFRFESEATGFLFQKKMRGGMVPSSGYVVALSQAGRRPWRR